MKIKKVEMQAFKGYLNKEDSTFDFMLGEEPAKLVAIHAPNGYGKTSFYDAVDYAITKNVHRFIRVPSVKTLNDKLSTDQVHDSGNDFCSKMILRSSNNPQKLDTKVTVDTTIEKFSVSIKSDKANRDYTFDPSKTPDDRKFFEKIILSQEAIDSYIRESRPEQRYVEFIDFQSDEIKNLELSRVELYHAITDLDKKRKELKKKLDSLINTSIETESDAIVKTKFESYKNELVRLDIDLPNFDGVEHDNIREQVEIVLRNKLYIIENKFNEKCKQQENLKREITKYSLKYKDSFSNIKKLISEKEALIEIRKHYDSYQVKNKNLLYEKNNIESKVQSLELINDYNEKISSYLETKRKVKILFEKNSAEKQKLLDITSSNSKLNKHIENSKEQLGNIYTYTDALNNKKRNLDTLYVELDELKSLRTGFIKNIEVQNKESSSLKNEVNDLKSRISKLRTIPFDNGAWELELENLSLISKEDYKQVIELKNTLRLIDIDEKKYKQEVSNVRENEDELKNLQSYGLTYLSKASNALVQNCPLCYSHFDSHKALYDKIENNDFLKDHVDPIYRKRLELKTRKESTVSWINEIKNRYVLLVLDRMSLLEPRLEVLELKLSELNNSISDFLKKLDTIEIQINNKVSDTKGKSKENLLKDIEEEVSLLITSQKRLEEIISKSNVSIIKNNEDAANIKSNIVNNSATLKELNQVEEFEAFLINTLQVEQNEINTIDESSIVLKFSKKIEILHDSLNNIRNHVEKMEAELTNLSQPIVSYLRMSNDEALKTFDDTLSQINSSIYKEEELVQGFNSILSDVESKNIYRLDEKEWDDLLSKKYEEVENESDKYKSILSKLTGIIELLDSYCLYLKSINIDKEINEEKEKIDKIDSVSFVLNTDIALIHNLLKKKIDSYFYSDLVNQIYSKIDPHPGFKKVVFECSFSDVSKPKLNVYLTNEASDSIISPNIYLSSAQISVLSLSIFLARALNAECYKGQAVDCILIDDPVQSMDSINVLSTIDLFRNLAIMFNKQIIISTHDERFYKLFKAKAPRNISKFIELEAHGKVRPN
ncbi:TPA: AAA family ATPase [Photobacterium damselae]